VKEVEQRVDVGNVKTIIMDFKSVFKKKKMKNPCWKGYKAIGMKKKGGRKVPNCVPKKKK